MIDMMAENVCLDILGNTETWKKWVTYCWSHFWIESIKTKSMENVITGVLEKIKNTI